MTFAFLALASVTLAPVLARAQIAVTFFYRLTPMTHFPVPAGFEDENKPLHAFLRLQGEVDGRAIDVVYGFFPTTRSGMIKSAFVHVPGSVLDSRDSDGGRGSENWDASYPVVSVTINDQSYKDLINEIDKWKADPEGYALWSRNCVNFADHIAKLLRMNTPASPDLLPANYMRQLEDANPQNLFTSEQVNEQRLRKPLTAGDLDRLRKMFRHADEKRLSTEIRQQSKADMQDALSRFQTMDLTRKALLQRHVDMLEAQRAKEIAAAEATNAKLSSNAPASEAAQRAAVQRLKDGIGQGTAMGGSQVPAASNGASSDFDPTCQFTGCISATLPPLAQATTTTAAVQSAAAPPADPWQPGSARKLPSPLLFISPTSGAASLGFRHAEKQVVYLGHVRNRASYSVFIQVQPEPGDVDNFYRIKSSQDVSVTIQAGSGSIEGFNPYADIKVDVTTDASNNNARYIAFYNRDGQLCSVVFFSSDVHLSQEFDTALTQNVTTGFGGKFSDWYTLPSGPDPLGYQLGAAPKEQIKSLDEKQYRDCASWARCEIKAPGDGSGYTFRFRVQGDDGGGGVVHGQERWFIASARLELHYALKDQVPFWLVKDTPLAE